MVRKSKAYRKELNRVRRESSKKLVRKLRKLKKKNSKQYWKLIGSNSKEDIPVPILEFFNHFKDLANDGDGDCGGDFPEDNGDNQLDTTMLNTEIAKEEIYKCIRGLRRGKAAGIDKILNEYIKETQHLLMPLYVKLFNKILVEGTVPDQWIIGLIIPIYKQKGNKYDANNYREIALLSCLGKLYTAVLN